MEKEILPIIQPELVEIEREELPLYKECTWDFEKGIPLFEKGYPKIVTGNEAVKVWVWKTLNTPIARYPIYNFEHGTQLEELIGQNYIPELKQSEAVRYIKEALEVNPYITEVTNVEVEFFDSTIKISATVSTIYGEEVEVNV